MLPNFYIAPLEIGFLKIAPVTVLVVLAVFALGELSYQRAKRVGLNTKVMVNGIVWGMIIGFPVSHMAVMVFYHPEKVLENPATLVMFWTGLSSFGGFSGGFLAAFIYFKKKKVSVLEYFDAGMFGGWPAWILGRLGCTIVFDHPGLPTNFFLGMEDRFGVVRHNLGFYDLLLAMVITLIIYGLRNVRAFAGFYLALTFFIYTSVRFFLDFLRVADRTYVGLTPGQYGSILFMALVIFLVAKKLNHNSFRHKAVKV